MGRDSGHLPTKLAKDISARHRIATNNTDKITLAGILQPDRKTGLGKPKRPLRFPIRAPQACERAIVEAQKGHSCASTVALLRARLGPVRPVFGRKYVSTKFKWLIVNVLTQIGH